MSLPNKYAALKAGKRRRTDDDTSEASPAPKPNRYAGLKVAKRSRTTETAGASPGPSSDSASPRDRDSGRDSGRAGRTQRREGREESVEELFRDPPKAIVTNAQKAEARSKKAVLGSVSSAIQKALRDPSETNIEHLSSKLASLAFEELWGRLIIEHALWTKDFPNLLRSTTADGIPEHIRCDARIIIKRWSRGDFSPDLLRGMLFPDNNFSNKKLDKEYAFSRSCDRPGHNGLEVGQWFPQQICMMRDGAHGEIEAGIHGSEEHGALSVLISGGGDNHGKYEDDDLGDLVFYCGTRSKENADKPSRGTQFLLDAADEHIGPDGNKSGPKHAVRLFRSSKAAGKYKPDLGMRYDGLYYVSGYMRIDEGTNHYRFTLERLPGQCPIRWQGVGVKPDEVQKAVWAKDLKERQGSKSKRK